MIAAAGSFTAGAFVLDQLLLLAGTAPTIFKLTPSPDGQLRRRGREFLEFTPPPTT